MPIIEIWLGLVVEDFDLLSTVKWCHFVLTSFMMINYESLKLEHVGAAN